MRIGVDLDGTVYEWERAARWLLRELRGHPEDGPMGETSDHWHYIEERVSLEDWQWLWSEGVRVGLFAMHAWTYPGAIDALRAIAVDHDLVVITKRPRTALVDTIEFLHTTALPVSELHVLHDGRDKSEVRPLCDVYIDDAPEVVGDLAANTPARVLLIDRPWNAIVRYAEEPAHAHGAKVLRVDWPEIPTIVHDLEEAR